MQLSNQIHAHKTARFNYNLNNYQIKCKGFFMHKNNNKKQETLKWFCHSQHVPEKANEFKDIT